MAEELPAPIVGPDIDLTKLDGFMLDTVALLGSELVALSTGEEFKAAVLLWCRAWKQRPACSLPNDDRILASFAMVPPTRWRKVREMALRGFVKCSDGRLYHPVLAKDALRADAARRQRANAIKARWEKEQARSTDNNTEEIRPYYGEPSKPIPTVARDGTGRDETSLAKPSPSPGSGCDERAHEVGKQCLAILGKHGDPTWNYGLVWQWLADGADSERHILATLKAMVAAGTAKRAKSLAYFTPAIMEAMQRSAPIARVSSSSADPEYDRSRAYIQLWLEGGDWPAHRGPPPTDPKNTLHPKALAEFAPQIHARTTA